MSGIPGNNHEAFFAMEQDLRSRYINVQVINPARIGIQLACEKMKSCRVPVWEEYMRACVKRLCDATHITFLPGCEASAGATLEKELARKLGIEELVL
jgi:hypothetical protein